MPDYYRILNLNENAALSDKEVKDAYFKLAKEWHPDSNKSVDAPSRFRLINEAYSNLKSKEQRIQYRFDVQQEAIIEHDNDWTKRHSRNRRHINPYAANFNDVNYEYNAAEKKWKASNSKGYNESTINFFRSFEKFIHPRVLFFYLPIGLLSYYALSSGSKHVYTNYIAPIDLKARQDTNKKKKWKQ